MKLLNSNLTFAIQFSAYKCCYCGLLNPARKQREFAPKLEQPKLQRGNSSTSLNSTVDEEDKATEENNKNGEITEEEKSSDISRDDSDSKGISLLLNLIY